MIYAKRTQWGTSPAWGMGRGDRFWREAILYRSQYLSNNMDWPQRQVGMCAVSDRSHRVDQNSPSALQARMLTNVQVAGTFFCVQNIFVIIRESTNHLWFLRWSACWIPWPTFREFDRIPPGRWRGKNNISYSQLHCYSATVPLSQLGGRTGFSIVWNVSLSVLNTLSNE